MIFPNPYFQTLTAASWHAALSAGLTFHPKWSFWMNPFSGLGEAAGSLQEEAVPLCHCLPEVWLFLKQPHLLFALPLIRLTKFLFLHFFTHASLKSVLSKISGASAKFSKCFFWSSSVLGNPTREFTRGFLINPELAGPACEAEICKPWFGLSSLQT